MSIHYIKKKSCLIGLPDAKIRIIFELQQNRPEKIRAISLGRFSNDTRVKCKRHVGRWQT